MQSFVGAPQDPLDMEEPSDQQLEDCHTRQIEKRNARGPHERDRKVSQ